MPLFTVLMDFGGGSYISQVRGRSVKHALRVWALTLDAKQIAGLGKVGLAEIQTDIEEVMATPLSGLSRVWCCSFLPAGRFALVNIVQTSE